MNLKKLFPSLFISIVILSFTASLSAQDAAKPIASLTWKSTTIDFGQIEQGKPVTAEFEFTNPSMVPLIINTVRSSCGCTVADYPKEPVQPGKSGKIAATFNAASTGAFTKTVTVNSNATEGTTVLVIKGEVIAKK